MTTERHPAEDVRIGARFTLHGRLRVVEAAGPMLLLLPGLGFHTFEYDALAGLLALAGFGSLALDYRGHGRSEGPRGRWVLHELVEDAGRGLDFLSGRGRPRVGVFGNSLGALVGVHLAARDSRVGSLVASGCPTRVADFASTRFRRALLAALLACERLVPLRVSVNHFIPYRRILRDPRIIERVRADPLIADARRFAPSTYQDMFGWSALEAVREVTVPMLVMYGELDDFQPAVQSTLLYEAARCEKELCSLPTGHVPDLESPALVAAALIRWFGRTMGAPERAAGASGGGA
jgi:pimeloyl-ACP methyl ester carboxylesterase